MHNRQRMRFSNRKAVLWLLKNGYDDIWLKPHTKRTDLTYTQGEWYRVIDLWNLFDGICFDDEGNIIPYKPKEDKKILNNMSKS